MRDRRHLRALTPLLAIAAATACSGQQIHVGFLWHMHQPIYYPYESILTTDATGRYSFSVVDVHNQRFGPYTWWPTDAIQAGLGMPHLGAQVSFSGSLIENLNNLEGAGVNGGMWNNWDTGYDTGAGLSTSLGNRRLDLVAFGYHHPLMPLLDERDIRMQIKLHKHVYGQTWAGGSAYSKGMFPPETAFATRIIPALVAEGVEWVLVDNIHFDRACQGYPYTPSSNLYPPNRADQINPDPAASGGAWVQLQNLWAPSRVSAPFGYQPHYAQHIDPETGQVTKMIVVPAARYEGNEDGRGGYGAFLYDQVMDAYLQYNTDPQHPMFVMLHHDGDNFGGGSEAYYHHNFQNMVSWASSDPDYDVTTAQDYLERFPPDVNDVIHVENGSWAGADNGDPEFKKWLGDPDGNGWSPDRNSWAVLTAAKNRVFTADDIAPAISMQNILSDAGTPTERAWHDLLVSQASDYWYWDGSGEPWDSNVTRGCNLAVAHADQVLATFFGIETTPPTIFHPQREPYNPGGYEWGATPEPSDFEVWTYVYDVSGLSNVTLKWRADLDGENPLNSVQNETYAGGPEVGPWSSVAMTASDITPPPHILTPSYRAMRYGAMITDQTDVLIDYYVEATDENGNIQRSDIQHVYVGLSTPGGGGDGGVTISPNPAEAGQPVHIEYDPAGGPLAGAGQVYLHYGFNNWSTVINPDPAMSWDATDQVWEISVAVLSMATQLDMVFNNGAGTWDNNSGQDWHFNVINNQPPAGWVMDGLLDGGATEVAANGGLHLQVGIEGDVLYVAVEDAGEGNDHFIYLADVPGALVSANWAKAGQIAQWDAFLADENDNDYEGWFDASGSTNAATGANGGVLEGTINLVEEFGMLPTEVALAVGVYQTFDGGALVSSSQVPPTINGDGNIDAAEYLILDLTTLPGWISPDQPGDADGDGDVDINDLNLVLGNFGNTGAPGLPGDVNEDGQVDVNDLNLVLGNFGAG